MKKTTVDIRALKAHMTVNGVLACNYSTELARLQAFADMFERGDWDGIVEAAGVDLSDYDEPGDALTAATRRLDPHQFVVSV
jgi:hypothetical protein